METILINSAVLSVVWVIIVSYFGEDFVYLFRNSGLILGPLLSSFILAFLPALLSAVTIPIVIQLLSGKYPGDTSGLCFSWSTIGSIAGVVITGYILLPMLGIKGAILTGAMAVVITIVFFAPIKGIVSIFVIFLVFMSTPNSHSNLIFEKTNGYHKISIIEKANQRFIYLDSTLEGGIKLGSSEPILQYQKKVGTLASRYNENLKRSFFLGGGSFSMPKFIIDRYPESIVTVAEIDQDVVSAGKKYLELPDSINVLSMDGRAALQSSEDDSIDILVNDAFNGVRKTPFHLLTLEFNQLVKDKLSFEGVYAVNTIGHPENSKLISSVIRSLDEIFPNVRVDAKVTTRTTNVWIFASESNIDDLGKGFRLDDESNAMLLTDDHAPIEYIIAKELSVGL